MSLDNDLKQPLLKKELFLREKTFPRVFMLLN